MTQFILFNDQGVIQDCYITDTMTVSGNSVSWLNGSIQGPKLNYGLAENGSYKIGDTLDSATLLSIAQSTKNLELNQSCQQAIFKGFDCIPLGDGVIYHFPFDTQAQANYNQYLTDLLCGDIVDQAWKVRDSTGVWSDLNLTSDQFKNNVRPVATSFKKAQINQYRTLVDTVMKASDITTIKGVTWSLATY